MKVRNTWIFFFFFFLALQDGNTGLFNGRIHPGKVGGNITVGCSFSLYGSRRLFCRNKCKEGNILIDTTEDKAQRDRYSIEYINTGVLSADTLYVSITQLKKSDSGQYRCYLERSFSPDSSEDFKITVTEASTTSQPTLTPGTFSSSAFLTSASTSPTSSSSSSPTSSSTLSSSSGSSTSSSSSSSSGATGHHEASPTDLILYVALTLVFMIIILSVALMIFCKWRRTRKPKGSPIESVHTDITRTDQLYEEIREDKQSSSPPEGISTVYTCAKYVKPNGAESSDDYSLNQSPQERVSRTVDEDDSSKLDYSEVDFSNVAVKSHNSALVDNVIYSAPKTETNSTNHAMGASPPLYSTLQ
ncbi:uncharacterized protein DDB_G0271670-like isoform X2 [Mugil cephalus]|uniref:uncharacterized protein DDB_G0271670-like isoform X2 n=1 Tax=Mugil cephalus TaxID=48193 RepID=UPI001FB6BDCA|nr:uncharacterized protein DDB_G0271670-like isoform X2 [Mugil cephalus]